MLYLFKNLEQQDWVNSQLKQDSFSKIVLHIFNKYLH